MKKTLLRMAILSAVISCQPTNGLDAATYESFGELSVAPNDNLALFANGLADQLSHVREGSTAEAPVQEKAPVEEKKSSFRWLGFGKKKNGEPRIGDSNPLRTPAVADNTLRSSAPVAQQNAVVSPKSRWPLTLAGHDNTATAVGPNGSGVIRAQANQDIFEMDDAQPQAVNTYGDEPAMAMNQSWDDSQLCDFGGCCDACCGGCCDDCCGGNCCCPRCCRPPCTIIAGTDVVFLGTDINGQRSTWRHVDNIASTTQRFGQLSGDAAIDDFYVAPRIWLGVQGCRWGIVGRYFHMRVGEHDYLGLDPTADYPLYSFNANSIFEAYYTDIELTRNFCLHGCKNQFTFGARYASIEHHESLFGRAILDHGSLIDGILEAGTKSNRAAHGTGLTFSLNGRKPLFCNSCANWFYSGRTSILWGPTLNDVETHSSVVVDPGATIAGAGSIDVARTLIDDDLFIGEFQFGIEWNFALKCLPARAFFRTAFEYQYWDASSGLAGADSFAGVTTSGPPATDDQVFVSTQARGLIVDMYGLSVATGFTW